jgi:hypothetical protein
LYQNIPANENQPPAVPSPSPLAMQNSWQNNGTQSSVGIYQSGNDNNSGGFGSQSDTYQVIIYLQLLIYTLL